MKDIGNYNILDPNKKKLGYVILNYLFRPTLNHIFTEDSQSWGGSHSSSSAYSKTGTSLSMRRSM